MQCPITEVSLERNIHKKYNKIDLDEELNPEQPV